MDEYIRKQAAIDALPKPQICEYMDEFGAGRNSCAYDAEKAINEVPTADVAPVVHAHWEYKYDTYCGFQDIDVRCSVCKTTTNIKRFRKTKWCPDCGAKMDGLCEKGDE